MTSPFDPIDIEFSVVSGSRHELLFNCIDSVERVMSGTKYRWKLTAICNASGEELPLRLRNRFPAISIIENHDPIGFAANHNKVLVSSAARFVWLLNDDLVLLPDSVAKVTEFMDAAENSDVAAVSPRLLNPDGSVQPSTYSFPSMPQTLLAHSGLREHPAMNRLLRFVAPVLRARKGSSRFWAHDETIEVDTLRGACVAMRMSAVKQIGLMSEVSIVGGEETEWHRRFKDHGWKVVFFAGASVIHYGSQTVGAESQKLRPEYLKGALHFFKTRRAKPVYTLFCLTLDAMFTVQRLFARVRGDAEGVELTRRYVAATNEAMRSTRS
jgi:GT2 family glycosyltransferase